MKRSFKFKIFEKSFEIKIKFVKDLGIFEKFFEIEIKLVKNFRNFERFEEFVKTKFDKDLKNFKKFVKFEEIFLKIKDSRIKENVMTFSSSLLLSSI